MKRGGWKLDLTWALIGFGLGSSLFTLDLNPKNSKSRGPKRPISFGRFSNQPNQPKQRPVAPPRCFRALTNEAAAKMFTSTPLPANQLVQVFLEKKTSTIPVRAAILCIFL